MSQDGLANAEVEGGGGGGGEANPLHSSVAGTAVLMKSVTKFLQGGRRGRAQSQQLLPLAEGGRSENATPRSGRGRRGGEDGRRMDYPAENLRGRQRAGARGGGIAGKTSPNLIEYFRKRTHFNKEEVDALCHVFCKLVETSQAHHSEGKARGGSGGPGGGSGAGGGGAGDGMPPAAAGGAILGAILGASGIAPLGTGIWMPTEGLDRVVFREVLHNTFDLVTEEVLMDRVFCAFDRRNDGVLRLDEWLLGLSVFVRGDANERTAFCFRVYDLNGDGVISRDEMFQLLRLAPANVIQGIVSRDPHYLPVFYFDRNCLMKQPNDEDPDEGVRDLVELSLKKMDRDRDGKVSFSDFQEAVNAEPLLLEAFGQCLPSEAACQSFMSTLLA